MKGHVGGGPVTDSLWVSVGRSNLCRSLMATRRSLLRRTVKCPNTQTHQFVYLCRNGSQRCRSCFRLFRRGEVVHKLESLILAQNERCRPAQHMQVERDLRV